MNDEATAVANADAVPSSVDYNNFLANSFAQLQRNYYGGSNNLQQCVVPSDFMAQNGIPQYLQYLGTPHGIPVMDRTFHNNFQQYNDRQTASGSVPTEDLKYNMDSHFSEQEHLVVLNVLDEQLNNDSLQLENVFKKLMQELKRSDGEIRSHLFRYFVYLLSIREESGGFAKSTEEAVSKWTADDIVLFKSSLCTNEGNIHFDLATKMKKPVNECILKHAQLMFDNGEIPKTPIPVANIQNNLKHHIYDDRMPVSSHQSTAAESEQSASRESSYHSSAPEDSSYHPSASNEAYHPSASNEAYHPSAPDDAYHPSAPNDVYHTSAPKDAYHPSAPDNAYHPSAPEDSSYHPSAPDDTYHPSAPDDAYHPSAPDDAYHPSAPDNAYHPSAFNEAYHASAPTVLSYHPSLAQQNNSAPWNHPIVNNQSVAAGLRDLFKDSALYDQIISMEFGPDGVTNALNSISSTLEASHEKPDDFDSGKKSEKRRKL
eukprot:GHVL01018874.1.p1 GENE.GHVL01018874.1~~GHVL01018874.1.p1  ORF type:complete len:486 (+),score=82.90 GHVL01018874.1:50-1507(+)